MIALALLFLALYMPPLSAAQSPPKPVPPVQEHQNRMLGLLTQDQNGLFILLVEATSSDVTASVRQFSPDHQGKPTFVSYPRELFDELWLGAKDLGLSSFAAANIADADVRASENYVITIGLGDDPKREMYLVPKCSTPAEIALFVKRLAHDLLPAGSPGLFAPCPQRSQPQ